MFVAYLGRVYFSDGLTQIVIGSIAVGVGTALIYSALPTLIMRAVPVTETASANGLNVLLRSLGTSTASATIAAVTTASAISVQGIDAPTYDSLALVFWLAAGASLGAAVIGIPMLGREEFSEAADRSGAEQMGRQAQVVRGQVLTPRNLPITNAVVTVLTPQGDAVDWGQADSEGRFTAAIPRADDYMVVTTAEGWWPRSRIMTLDDSHPLPPIVLRDRLTLSGTITDSAARPVTDALVVVTRHSGEVVGTVRTDHDGHYDIPRPPTGRYVLTVSSLDGAIGARPVTVWEAARSVDLTLGTPLA